MSNAHKKQQKAAIKFVENWIGHGYEKGETQKFWIDLLSNVFGVDDISHFIYFEEKVKDRIQEKTITNFIDAYIPSTRVMIEQKSSNKDLREPIRQSDGSVLTPFQQAKKYVADLPLSQHPKWIVTCNFNEFLIYDMENPNDEPEQIFLKDLEKDYYRLQFLVDKKNEKVSREEEISLKAGVLVGKLYDALRKEYIDPSEDSLRSLNILCVRIVFCLYAEDAGLFESKTAFEDYVKSFDLQYLRKALIDLFKGLDTKIADRDKYDTALTPFPYVNGGLFRDDKIEIPNFTQEIVDVIVNHCAPFNWSDISPTIFGAVFESTLNPETRRKGGMHYTSIANIHKVIDPLFMDDLTREFESICAVKAVGQKTIQLLDFQRKLGSLKFLDPACGSGNFLTETYLSLRRLENKVISLLNKGERVLGFDDFIKVRISQFYGIEINDFAVTVAKTALWIAESQMVQETEAVLSQTIEFLPLTDQANIVEGNALNMDWSTLTESGNTAEFIFTDKLNLYKVSDNTFPDMLREPEHEYNVHYRKELNVVAKEVEEKELPKPVKDKITYDYIIGNPPFVGYGLQSEKQKADTLLVYADENGKPYKNAGKIDYVANWYFLASKLIQGTKTRCAFVSTNSVTQGEQVTAVWKPVFERFKIHFDFAYQTFKWENETADKKDMAAVHCVIIGFSSEHNDKEKLIFPVDGKPMRVKNISPYLIDTPTIWIESRKKPVCDVPYMTTGNRPADGGHLIIEEDEYDDFVRREPKALKYIKKLTGSEEYINNKKRYCLWLVGASPAEIRDMKEVYKRVLLCRDDRLKGAPDRQKLADTPALFREINNPEKYLIVPATSSENRFYIPLGFLDYNTIPTNSALIIPNAGLYEFGILTSLVHMTWMRTVCGRLKSDYRYSKDIVYNNFPWCNPTEPQKTKIESTAQAILEARASYPDSSLADLYDEVLMPPELRKAHRENDKAVMEAYGFKQSVEENEIVAELFKLYEKLTIDLKTNV